MIRMLIVGYCRGIRSERRLCEDVHCESAFEFDPSSLRQFKKLPRRSAFGPHAE
jgi:transposase